MSQSIAEALNLATEIRKEVDRDEERGLLFGAEYILKNAVEGGQDVLIDIPKAKEILLQFIQHLLDNDQFEAAATVLWGPDVYDWRPKSARDTWRVLFNYDKTLVQGAGSMGKSFNAAAWFYLDWLRDPFYTSMKVISLTREHAERNIFAHLKNFHRMALVTPEFEKGAAMVTSIQANEDAKQGIHLVAIPKGESGHGTLRGFHPVPRFGKLHPRWGRLSRIRVVLDEAEEIPGGVWEGVNNIMSSMDMNELQGHVKVFGASNPKDRASDFGIRCEPTGGWNTIDCEDDLEWESREGYHVLRIDAARCENVVGRKIKFHGLQTYDGYMNYANRGATPEYYTMARGWFPEEGMAASIITPAMFDNST